MSQTAKTKSVRYIEVPANISTPPSCRVVCLESLRMSCDPACFIPVLLRDASGLFCGQTHWSSTVLPFPTFNECSKDNVPLFFFRRTEQRDRPENHRAKKLLEYFSQKMFKRHNTFYGDVLIFWRRSVDEVKHEMKLADFTLTDFNRFLGYTMPSDNKGANCQSMLYGAVSAAPVAPPPINFSAAGLAKRKDMTPPGGVRIGSSASRPKGIAWNFDNSLAAMKSIEAKLSNDKLCDNHGQLLQQETLKHNLYGLRNAAAIELLTRQGAYHDMQDCSLGAMTNGRGDYASTRDPLLMHRGDEAAHYEGSDPTPDTCAESDLSENLNFTPEGLTGALPVSQHLSYGQYTGLLDDQQRSLALSTLRTFLARLQSGLAPAAAALDTISSQDVLDLQKINQRQGAQIAALRKEIQSEQETNKRQLEELTKLKSANADLTRDLERLKSDPSEHHLKNFLESQNVISRQVPHSEDKSGVGHEAFCHQPPPGRWVFEDGMGQATLHDVVPTSDAGNSVELQRRVSTNNNDDPCLERSVSTGSETNNYKEEESPELLSALPSTFRVVQIYTPPADRKDDESDVFMAAQFGDEVTVDIKDSSGWWWVLNKRSHQKGWYPSSYLDSAECSTICAS